MLTQIRCGQFLIGQWGSSEAPRECDRKACTFLFFRQVIDSIAAKTINHEKENQSGITVFGMWRS